MESIYIITNEVHITAQGFYTGPEIQEEPRQFSEIKIFISTLQAKYAESATAAYILLLSQRLRKDNVAIAGYYIYPCIQPTRSELLNQQAL